MTEEVQAAFRCSAASRSMVEPLEGTASTVRALLLLEAAGPWGVEAIRDSRLPAEVKQRLSELEAAHGVRPLLIRRPGRPARAPVTGPEPVRLFAAYVRTDRPWTETAVLGSASEVLDLDLDLLGSGRSPGLTPHSGQVFAVCTHGRHDACCATHGRPVAAALAGAAPEQTWEVSHIGGDRFAANVLVLPHGLYYGRLDPTQAAGFAAAHLAGRLDLTHLRGRCAYPFSVQAAEVYLRRHLQDARIEPFELAEHTRSGTETAALFVVDGQQWEVRVHSGVGEPRRLTCRAAASSLAPTHRLLRVSAPRPDRVGLQGHGAATNRIAGDHGELVASPDPEVGDPQAGGRR